MRKPADRELHIYRVSIFRPARRESNAQPVASTPGNGEGVTGG
jgi:hypothetical protein